MIIIGITGTIGAGKGTLVDYLIEENGFDHYSVRAYLTEIIKERGMVVNRDSMVVVANGLRAEHGSSYVTDQLFLRAKKSDRDCVIESIRTPGEIDSLREKGNFILLAIDADQRCRFDRITLRKSSTDNVDFETFISNEAREMTSTKPEAQNLRRCIEMADFVLDNNGTIEELRSQYDKIATQFKDKAKKD